MSLQNRTPSYNRFSRDGFEPLNRNASNGAIPLQEVVVDSQDGTPRKDPSRWPQTAEKTNWRPPSGMRKARPAMMSGVAGSGHHSEGDAVTKMGKVYNKILGFSIITRYMLYVLPLGLMLAIPIIVGATAGSGAYIGGVRIVWVFVWLECSWVGLWASKIFARFLPSIFQFLCGIVSSGTRKYALVIRKLEIPLSLCGWALVSLATFKPLMTRNPDTLAQQLSQTPHWESVVQQILAAFMISSIIFLAEKMLIQLISIDYHRQQFSARIAASKHNVYLLALLYDASRALFPQFCHEFAQEDALITDSIELAFDRKKHGHHHRSGSSTPMKLIRNVGRIGDKITSAFGNVAQEITGKQVFNPDSAHSIVVEALEKTRSSEALAKRLWMSFVVEGHDALYREDIVEVLGDGHEVEAEDCFWTIDGDANGDVSLDEMILYVTQCSRERHALASSMHDVDQAINVLDKLLCTIVFIIVVFIFLAFLNTSFVTTLATAGTALLSLSFVFSATAQEVLGSCIFLFVKHPYDIGDRVDLNYGTDQMVVEQISLLFTVFRRVTNYRTVQIPHIVLNGIWVENVSRSKAMREQIAISVAADTSLEDVQILKADLTRFVQDKDNSRDFQSTIEVEVLGISDLSKMDLLVEAVHKSNWSNESIRAARRSKLMCALVLALRKVPIYGPGGGAPSLGEPGNPSYSVSITDFEAQRARDKAAAGMDAVRLIPNRPAVVKEEEGDGSTKEEKASEFLNERSPALDGPRDEAESPVAERSAGELAELDQVRGLLTRQTTKGKRKSSKSTKSTRSATIQEPASTVPRLYQQPSSAVDDEPDAAELSVKRNSSILSYQENEHIYRPAAPQSGYPPAASGYPRSQTWRT